MSSATTHRRGRQDSHPMSATPTFAEECAAFLAGTSRDLLDGQGTATGPPTTEDMMSLTTTGTAPVPTGPAATGAVLDARDLHKTFHRGLWPRRRSLHVLRGAGLELRRGEIVGLVGENGSGKSTLMKVLSGALARDAGTVRRSGRVGYCPQEPILYQQLTCHEHFDLFGRAYAMTREQVAAAREGIYATLGFGDWAEARVNELSGGTRAKLNLGLALLPDPEVLLLDEPYAGFDWETYQRFWTLATDRRDTGRAVLIISHFVTDEDRFDRIYQMRDGLAVPR